ncbi:MAG: Ltp family lipoprotein [Coriobacteriaceae bacterium]|nr:Ltp family lipoprotein [Coriobacteriaceae bacterium]
MAATQTSDTEGEYYNNGEYFAEGKGIGGKVPVTVTIDGGAIVDVEVGKNSETQGIGSKAIEQLPSAIVAANGTEGVDAVSGATVTSKAIFTAVDDCLEQAGTTSVKPETVMSDASPSIALESRDSAKSSSGSTDPLGVQKDNTLLFGDLAVELPNDYIGELKKSERGTQSVGVFSSEAMHVFCIVCYTTELAEYTTTGAEQAAILAVAETLGNLEHLKPISDDSSEPLSKLGTNSAGTEVYLGSCKGTSKSIEKEVPALITATVDTDGNLLVVLCIITDSEGADEAVPISRSLLASALPDAFDSSTPSSSTSTSSSEGQTTNRSSYTPTRGEQNALSTAHDYLDTMAFSRSGLIDQLKYEGYTSSEAEYAVDNCGADWDYQAVLMAEEYLDALPFSRSGLIEQLEYEGFSYSQASAAATAAGL